MRRLNRRDQRGTSVVEFAFVVPVLMATIGMAFFAAHIYEVSSDLQRTAERSARYAAVQCDPRDSAAINGCSSGTYHTVSQIQAFAQKAFHNTAFVVTAPTSCTRGLTPRICVNYDPTRADSPVPNQQVEVRLRYRYDEPFAPFLRAIGMETLVDLNAAGESTVE